MLIGLHIESVFLIADCKDLRKEVKYSYEGPNIIGKYSGVVHVSNGDTAMTEPIYLSRFQAKQNSEKLTKKIRSMWKEFIKRSDNAM